MRDPIRVLVIEDRKSDRFIAQELLGKYDLDFTWQRVGTESELRTIAQGFNPSLVFSADELTLSSRSAALDMLRLLSLQTAVIRVVEVNDTDDSLGDPATLEWKPIKLPEPSALRLPAAVDFNAAASAVSTPWWKPLPSLLDTSGDLIAISDAAGWITYANTDTSRLLGDPQTEAIGTVLGQGYDFAAPGRGPHGLAFFEALTDLPHPVHLSDLVGCMMDRAQGDHTALPIVALDLQGLRFMNESCGRAMSDEVLSVVGCELKSGAAVCGMIARVGEDDILLVLPEPSSPWDAAVNVQSNRRWIGVAEQLVDISALPIARAAPRPGAAAVPSPAPASGAAPTPSLKETVSTSINTLPVAKPRLPVEAGLDDALQRHAIGVHYQPQFELQSGRGCGVEALARWVLASGESMAPTTFIAVAEKAGMIHTLGASVLKNACHTAAAWNGRDAERLTVSVNLSTLQINADFSKSLARILQTSGLAASRLELEIAEAAVLANTDLTVSCLKEWRRMGVRVAVNHAGNNYSSLSYLSRLPVDRLKLDKSLIHTMASNDKSTRIIHALISLGAALGIEVIAEGVETEAQFQTLMELGCVQAQGYLLGRPMPAVQAQVALRKPWGNLPRAALRAAPVVQEKYAS